MKDDECSAVDAAKSLFQLTCNSGTGVAHLLPREFTMHEPIDPKMQAAATDGAPVASRTKRQRFLWPAILIAILLIGCFGYLLSIRFDVIKLSDGIWTRDLRTSAAVLIFLATYVVIAVGKLPGYRIDRAGAALLGGVLMVGIGGASPAEAYGAIDFDTISCCSA